MNDDKQPTEDREDGGRRVYEAPSIAESGRFENLVLMCSKLPETTPICGVAPRSAM